MSSVVIKGDTSGQITLAAPTVAGTNTLSLPAVTATLATEVNGVLYPLTSGTAVASTSGTSIDFTGVPSWVKRITVMFNGVSTNSTSIPVVRLGTSGGVQATGYSSVVFTSAGGVATISDGFAFVNASHGAGYLYYGSFIISNLSGNIWTLQGGLAIPSVAGVTVNGAVTLSAILDRIRLTTQNGTDTFDAGSINILYE